MAANIADELTVEQTINISSVEDDDNLEKVDENAENVTEKHERSTKLPMSRIKTLMKMDPDVTLASQEAVFLITKSTELFIENLAKESYIFTSQNRKKTIQKKDVDSSIDAVDALVFLEGTLD